MNGIEQDFIFAGDQRGRNANGKLVAMHKPLLADFGGFAKAPADELPGGI